MRKGIAVAAPADLKGKKIGVPGLNSVIDVLVRKWLVDRGVPVQQVTIVEAPFPQMSDLLRGGTLDAVAVLEPFRSKIVNEGTGTKVSDFVGQFQTPYEQCKMSGGLRVERGFARNCARPMLDERGGLWRLGSRLAPYGSSGCPCSELRNAEKA